MCSCHVRCPSCSASNLINATAWKKRISQPYRAFGFRLGTSAPHASRPTLRPSPTFRIIEHVACNFKLFLKQINWFLFIFRGMTCQGIPIKLIHVLLSIAMLSLEVISWIQPMLIPMESQRKLLVLGWAGTTSSRLYPSICNRNFLSICKSHWV